MIVQSQSILIDAPPAEVFAYVNDPRELPSWTAGVIEIRNIRGCGEGLQYDFTYRMVGVQLRGQSVIIEYVENRCAAHQGIGMMELVWTNRVEPADGGTKLTIEVEYGIPVPVLGILAERLTVRRNERNLELALINVKEILER